MSKLDLLMKNLIVVFLSLAAIMDKIGGRGGHRAQDIVLGTIFIRTEADFLPERKDSPFSRMLAWELRDTHSIFLFAQISCVTM